MKVNGSERGTPLDKKRRAAVPGRNPGTHLLERHDDPTHRPAVERFVANDPAGEGVGGQDPGQHAHGAAGITRVQGVDWRDQTANAAAGDSKLQTGVVTPCLLDFDAQGSQARER